MSLLTLRKEVEKLTPTKKDLGSGIRRLLDGYRTADAVLDLVDEYISMLPAGGDPLTYRHPNGFYKITILRRSCGTIDVRVHAWPRVTLPEVRLPQLPHNHQWDYWSRIVAGEFEHREYDVEHSDSRPSHHRFVRSSVRDDNSCVLQKRGSVNLVVTATSQVRIGDIVDLRSVATHAIDPIGNDAALTLVVLRRVANPDPVTVYVDSIEGRVEFRGERRALAKNELEEMSAILRDQLTPSSRPMRTQEHCRK